jgi:hypothetical protein
MPSNNSQKNVNNAVQKVVVNVNTSDYPKKKRPQKKRSPPDVPIEQEQPIIRPTTQQPLNPRRPSPYLPNMVQVHNNTHLPPPPYFAVPATNQTISINNMRESFEEKLQDLYHTLTRNAQTQAELDEANSAVASARASHESELSSMMTSGYPPSSSTPSSGLPPPNYTDYRGFSSSLSSSPMHSERYSYAPSHPFSSPRKANTNLDDVMDAFNKLNIKKEPSVKSEPMSTSMIKKEPSVKSEPMSQGSMPPLVQPRVKNEPMSQGSIQGTSVLRGVSVVNLNGSESGSTVPINVINNSDIASNGNNMSSIGSNGDSYIPQQDSSNASRANSLLNEYRNASRGSSRRSMIGQEIRRIANSSGVSAGTRESLESIVNRINGSGASN